jgi:hypothetical protein
VIDITHVIIGAAMYGIMVRISAKIVTKFFIGTAMQPAPAT